MKHRKQKNMAGRALPLSGTGLALLLILLAFCGYTAAKYVMDRKTQALYVAESFYFESDLLKEQASNGTWPEYTLQSGADTISFQLKNYPDELRYSEVDIICSVSVLKDGQEFLQNGQSSMTYTIAKGERNSQPVRLTGLSPGKYEITAEAVSPYAKTLKASFNVVGADQSVAASVSDSAGSPVAMLTVTVADVQSGQKNLTITWPAGLAPDNTDPLLGNAQSGEAGGGGSCSVEFEANSQYTFLFFKKDPKDSYSLEDFGVQ